MNNKRIIGILAATGLSTLSVLAGSATYDFNSAPPADLNFVGNAEWRDSGGVNGSGYMALFDALNSLHATVLIPDFDSGMVVKAFTFEVDLRVGNAVGNDGRPADGFSINFAHADDPVVLDLSAEPPVDDVNKFALAGAPEAGTLTGLSICFDTWSGNTLPDGLADIEGIIIRVDNKTKVIGGVNGILMPTRNGACDDSTSMQTGPYDAASNGSPDGLCWAHLKVDLAENGELTVNWKGKEIVSKLATGFLPTAGRLVFSGRTGGANENTHIDNLKITTTPAESAVVTTAAADAVSVSINLEDSGLSIVDASTLVMSVDGTPVTPVTTSKSGKVTTVRWVSPDYLVAGRELSVSVTGKDTRNVAISGTRTTAVAAYTTIPAAFKVPTASVDTSKVGFLVRPFQTAAVQPNTLVWTEAQLLGLQGENLADFTGATGGFFTWDTVLNFNAAAPGEIGNFNATGGFTDEQFPGMPGTTASTGNFAEEVLTYLNFPSAGLYQLGVNSDDGFRVTSGRAPGDILGTILGYFDGGRGASDTIFSVVVTEPGYYPIRLIYENGNGELPDNGSNMEFFSVKDGVKTLINATTAGAIKAYRQSTAEGPYVSYITPQRGATGVEGNAVIMAEISNGSVQVDSASVKVKVNGTETPATVTSAASKTALTVNTGLLPSGQTVTVTINFSDKSTPAVAYTAEWQFTVAAYSVLSEELWTAPGTGDAAKPGMKARVYQVDQPGSNSLPNRTHRAEQELAGVIGPNVADLSGATAGVFEIDMVNWNQDTTEIGNFQSTSTPSRPDSTIPGIPGTGSKPDDSVAGEVITYLEFPAAGYYTMGANADDGFKVTLADTPPANNQALVITGSSTAAGTYFALSGPPESSKPFTAQVSGQVVYMSPADGCSAPVNAEALRGNIALVDRGTCEFTAKIKAAREAGAIACILVNNRDIANAEGVFPITMGAGASGYQDIPAVMISMPDGDKIKAGLASGLTATITPDTTPAVGERDGDSAGADVSFSFIVPKAGVYPFRLVWFEGNGGANLEWFSVTKTGTKILVNDRENSAAIKAFRARTASPETKPTISMTATGGNMVITFTGTLQSADSVTGTWTDVGTTSPFTVSTASGNKFFRAKR